MARHPDESPENMPLPPLPESDDVVALPPGLGPDPQEDGLSFSPAAPRRGPGIRQTMMEAAEGRVSRETAEREGRELQAFVAKLKGSRAGGSYLEIRRVGPSNIPPQERGVIGKLKLESLKGKDIADEIRKSFGGGAYHVQARNAEHHDVTGGFFEVEIVGNIVPQSREGALWLRSLGPDPEEGGSRLMQELLDRQRHASSGANDSSVIALMMQQQQQLMQTIREENDARRRQEDQKRQDEREERRARDAEEAEKRRIREKAEDEERRRRDAEYEAERKERLLRLEAQLKTDADERAARHERELAELKADREERLKRFEMQNAGALGMSGMKRIMGQVEELFVDKIRDTAGANAAASDVPEDWGSVVRQVAVTHGADLLGRVLDIVETKGGTQAPGARRVGPVRQLPPPVAAPGTTDDAEADEPTAPQAPAQPAGSSPDADSPQAALSAMGQAAAQKAAVRLVAFVRIMGTELLAQGDAEAAWSTPQDESEPPLTLADVYLALPTAAKKAWRQGWSAFAAVAAPYAHADLDAIGRVVASNAAAAEWLREFMESGPYDEDAPAFAPATPGEPEESDEEAEELEESAEDVEQSS